MGKGFRERFRVKLYLERPQKKAWALMGEQAKAVTILANAGLERWEYTLEGGIIARDFFLTDKLKRGAEALAPDLLPLTVEGLLDRAWSAFSARIGRKAKHRNQGTYSPEFDLPPDQVVFSISETIVRVPYLGLVRHVRNKFIQAKDLTQVSDNIRWLQQNIRRMWLGNQASDHFLHIDCTNEEEDARRKAARAEKLRVRKMRKSERTVSKWLDTPVAKDSDD
ncbi:hypothetical protein LCGC14_1788840 [marine sediment metagenome]|uniref:Uncharacterized protein n=1 Tax=marine sediment metagenome TaxID=412755 RepID=A0A0F9GT40_9ZZZZ